MAGSYGHLMNGENCGWSLIENMGDANECVEELLWLILRAIGHERALELLKTEYFPMKRGEQLPDAALNEVNTRMSQ